jgi:hypothetical protein
MAETDHYRSFGLKRLRFAGDLWRSTQADYVDRAAPAEKTRWLPEFSFPNRVGVTSCCPEARR